MDVDVGGQVLRVDVRSEEAGQRVRVGTIPAVGGAATVPVSAHVRVGTSGAGLCVLVAGGPQSVVARSYDVAIGRSGPGEFVVHIGGRAVLVRLPHLLPRHTGSAARGGGAQRITAGIPGRIVRVLVRPGDAVAARQPVVVVEAMKMQNELRAPYGGIVTAVHTVEGALVEAGAPLVDIGPSQP